MRTLVDIPEAQIKELARLSAAERRSRASIIREATTAHLTSHKRKKGNFDAALGLWGDRKVDGVEYPRKLRAEW